MKKRFGFYLFIVFLTMSLCCCQSEDTVKRNELSTVIYGQTENSSIFHVNEEAVEKFNPYERNETRVKNIIDVNILGTKYKGEYKATVRLPCSDRQVYNYTLKETDSARILIDVKTKEIIQYHCIPYDEELISEEDYIQFIKKMLGDKYDLTSYDYKCTTHYYRDEPSLYISRVVDGFKFCEENEKIGSYTFYYTKSIEGINLQDHIFAEFFDGKIKLELYEYGYEKEKFLPILDRLDEIEASVEEHLKDNVKDSCTIISMKHNYKKMFIQDGIPYVVISSTVTYKSEISGGPWETVIETITG